MGETEAQMNAKKLEEVMMFMLYFWVCLCFQSQLACERSTLTVINSLMSWGLLKRRGSEVMNLRALSDCHPLPMETFCSYLLVP